MHILLRLVRLKSFATPQPNSLIFFVALNMYILELFYVVIVIILIEYFATLESCTYHELCPQINKISMHISCTVFIDIQYIYAHIMHCAHRYTMYLCKYHALCPQIYNIYAHIMHCVHRYTIYLCTCHALCPQIYNISMTVS